MAINNINNLNIQTYQCSFKKKDTQKKDVAQTETSAQLNYADTNLNAINEYVQELYAPKPTLKDKIFGLPTLTALTGIGYLGYMMKLICNLFQKKIATKPYFLKFGIATGICFLTNFLGTTIANANYDKHFKQLQDYFNSINDTHSKLSDKIINDKNVLTYQDGFNETLFLTRATVIDPWQRLKCKKYLFKYALSAAKQTEMIARTPNGIKKLNFLVLSDATKNLLASENGKKEISQIYNDIILDNTDKYNVTYTMYPYRKINYKNMMIGMYMLANNPNADINELPTVIDEEHYKKVIKDLPPLTPEEEKKIEEYYQAILDHPEVMQKQMFKENVPWYARII